MVFLFLLFIIVPILEVVLSVTWNESYFRSGFPVYHRLFQGSSINSNVISDYHIEKLLSEYGYDRISFRLVQDNYFIFKEKAFKVVKNGWSYAFLPIMHGNLIITPNVGKIIVIGRLNWSVVIALIIIGSLLINKTGYLFSISLLTILFLTYFYQMRHFYKIADVIAKNLKTLQSHDMGQV